MTNMQPQQRYEIGLGVMECNLLLKMADPGFSVWEKL
jgi:hypothetical protein